MFTREDYDKYFDEIARIERKMIYRSYELQQELDDPALTGLLQKIGDDEVRHYGYVLKMFRRIEDSRQVERRLETREYCLGTLLLRRPGEPEDKSCKAFIVNLSDGGVFFEGGRDFPPQEDWELTVHLFGKEEEPLRRSGRVIWSKQVEPGFYISAIRFRK